MSISWVRPWEPLGFELAYGVLDRGFMARGVLTGTHASVGSPSRRALGWSEWVRRSLPLSALRNGGKPAGRAGGDVAVY
jgi:hypothetical protein